MAFRIYPGLENVELRIVRKPMFRYNMSMSQETPSVQVCPGVEKVWLQGSSGFVYRMSTAYLHEHSPFALQALVEAGCGIPGTLYLRDRADMLILGPGRYERELLQPVEIVNQKGFKGRPVHVHGIDLNPVPDDVEDDLAAMQEANPQINITHYEGKDVAALPAIQPLIRYFETGARDKWALYRATKVAGNIHRSSTIGTPIDTVSIQGMMDYLQPKEASALLVYVAQVIRPSALVIRLAYGDIGRTFMSPGDRERFEESIEKARLGAVNKKYEYTTADEFNERMITLSMPADEKRAARLSPDYPGSYPPVDTLLNFLQSTDGFCLADSAVELWKLPNREGKEEIASILVTLRHW